MWSWSSTCRFGIGAIAMSCGVGSAISAAQLEYNVVTSESNVTLSAAAQAGINVTPDFTELLPPIGDEFPTFAALNTLTTTQPTNESKVFADVGLPGGFDNGAHGITIDDFSIILSTLAPLEGFGIVPVPLDITGSNFQSIVFFAEFASFRIDLDTPFFSSLTPTGNPDEWLFGGLANVTLSGVLEPTVTIPTVTEIPLGQVPFSQQVTVPIVGTFSGNSTSTRVALGIEQDALQDQNLNLPEITEQVVLVPPDLVTLLLNLREFNLADISTAVVYQNSFHPIPEPNTALLLGLGLVGIALRRRR